MANGIAWIKARPLDTLRPLAGKPLKELALTEMEIQEDVWRGPRIGPEEAEAITKISDLKRLFLSYCDIENSALSRFEHSKLASLSLRECRDLSAADLKDIAKIGTLKELELRCTYLDEEAARTLCQLTHLQRLLIGDMAIDEQDDVVNEVLEELKKTMGNRFQQVPD